MLTKKLTVTTILLTLALLVGLVAQAQSADLYQRMGVLDASMLEKGSVIIYDVEYTLEPSAPVYMFDAAIDNTNPELRRQVSQMILTPGTRIGYTVTYKDQSQQGKITEIWVLPPGIVAASEEES